MLATGGADMGAATTAAGAGAGVEAVANAGLDRSVAGVETGGAFVSAFSAGGASLLESATSGVGLDATWAGADSRDGLGAGAATVGGVCEADVVTTVAAGTLVPCAAMLGRAGSTSLGVSVGAGL